MTLISLVVSWRPWGRSCSGRSRRWRRSSSPAGAGLWSPRRSCSGSPPPVGAAVAPRATADQPEHVLVVHHQDADAPGARVLAWAESGVLPEAKRRAAPFGAREARPVPWAWLRPSFTAPVAREALAAPELHLASRSEEGGRRRIRARLVSPRGAADASLLLPPEAEVVSGAVNGVPLPPPGARLRRWFGGFLPLRCLTTPPGGVELVSWSSRGRARWRPGWPTRSRACRRRRPASPRRGHRRRRRCRRGTRRW